MNNRKYDLMGAGIFAVALILMLMFMPKAAISGEKADKIMCVEYKSYFEQEWCKFDEYIATKEVHPWIVTQYNEAVEFQKASWEQGKQQNKDNWNSIQSFLGINEKQSK